VRIGVRGDDEHASGLSRVVPDPLGALGPSREDNRVSLGEDALALGCPKRRSAAEDDDHLLAAVMQVVPILSARLELPDGGAERASARTVEAAGADASPVRDLVRDVRHHAAWIGESAAG